MVFKELEIQGFKSFPDKVKISFDTGVTGVVGPNGSGKSNLSDAVRWVLGETSSRQLRAAGKMEDVIFGGTRKRSPMGFAQVRLTLDNAAHTLDVDADEVTIGRKYYRSGDSEYTINGQVCRLRDVYELLLDTGIGRDGYSVIGQGRIAEIVAAKSSERREIFEEACGIAKYRYRKTEAERRLAAAGENLERLRDILGELESRVGPLEKESAKAQKFLELSAQRKTLEVTLWTDGVHRAREAVRQQVRDYETAQTDYERFDRETKAAEQEAEEIRMQAQQLTVAVERLNGDIRSITQQISGSESRIAVLENDILRNDESAASLQQEIAAGQQDTAEADAALQRHRAVAKTMEAAGEKLAAEIEALNAELARLADASTASGARKDSLRAELADRTAKRTEAQVAQAAAEAAGDTARQRLPALEQSARDAAAQLEETKQDLADTVKYRQTLEENEKQLGNIRSGLELKLRSRSRCHRAAAGQGTGCRPAAPFGAAGTGKEYGRLPKLGACGHARRRGTPSAGHSGAGIHHPEGGARVRGCHRDRAGRRAAEHRSGKRSRRESRYRPAAQRPCRPRHLSAAGYRAARRVPRTAVRHGKAGLCAGAG